LYAYEQFWRAVIDEQALIDGGYTKGRTEGEAIGRAEGEQARAIETARKMKGDGMPSELIVKYTGLSVDMVNSL
jgi:predicted transposase YdaD